MTLLEEYRSAKESLAEIADNGGLYLNNQGCQCATREYNEALRRVREIEAKLDQAGIDYEQYFKG